MLKINLGKKTAVMLALCLCMCGCGGASAEENPSVDASAESTGQTSGLSIQKEESSELLYVDALEKKENKALKFTTVRRGDFIVTTSVEGKIVYPEKKQIRYEFPYGNTYYLEALGTESRVKNEGDAIAAIYVEMDEIQLASMERSLQRMEERGETGSAYEELKKQLAEMSEALNKTEILMETEGILLQQDTPQFGSRITSYTIVVADPTKRMLEVANTGGQFRYGQKVTVTAKINGVDQTGTGTVITASPGNVSAELVGGNAYICLDEDSEYLYNGGAIRVSVDSVRMEDVLLLDASAVYMKNGVQMVKVKDEYGLHEVTFSFGRKNASAYWVIDGLEEGAEILVQ